MKKKTKNKENNKLIIVIIATLLIVAIIASSTYAYWSWQTETNQQTNVSVTVKGGTLNIIGTNVTSTSMRPTNDCDGAASLIGTATVTAVNETATDMLVTLKIRGTISSEGTLNSTNKGKLNWAIVETASNAFSTTDNACDGATYSGTLATATSSGADINTGITYTASANATTTKYYKVYVWLDETYTFTNTGNSISDPMQKGLNLSVKWSPESTMAQQ